MAEKLIAMKVADFVDLLASDTPAPGGGSVAALAGAQAAGLMAMVCRLTIGKKKYVEVEERIKTGLAELEKLRTQMTALVDADTDAYNAFGAAMAMPKETDKDKAARRQAMRQASKLATEVPAETMAAGLAVARLIRRLHPIANKNCLSDMGTAMMMTNCAVLGAAMNVLINLPGTGDEAFNEKFAAQVAATREEMDKIGDDTTGQIFVALAE